MARRVLLSLLCLTLAGIGSPPAPAPASAEDAAGDKVKWLLDAAIKEPPEKETPAAQDTQGEHQFRRLEFRSEVRVKRFVETAVRRYVASEEYIQVPPADREKWCPATKTPTGLFGPGEHCYAIGDDDKRTTLELDLHRHPAGGFEMYFFGTQYKKPEKDGEKDRVPNQELEKMSQLFGALLGELESAKLGGPHDDYSLYPLSYIQADRAVAILKTLGYPVIEYSRTAEKDKTTAEPDRIFDRETDGALSRPAIINLIDAETTSLVQATEASRTPGGRVTKEVPSASVLTGGQRLDAVTDGVPLQQLLIVFDDEDREALYELLRILNEEIDVPARQILIEALVVELDRDSLKDVGIDLTASEDGGTLTAREESGVIQPLLLEIVRPSPQTLFEFNLRLRALVEDGTATVLSRPSVLVLDGRQARIKVGDEVPFTSQVALSGTLSTTATSFLSTGIILNLRPRASADDSQVTFQVETIISSAGPSRVEPGTGILIAPDIQSRQVQTLVRVANDTPFVIGGLIDRSVQEDLSKVPGLSKIPGLGRLFRKKTFVKQDKEVIVVITPHIIPVEEDASKFVLPRESDLLDSFGSELFRDTYRLRRGDVFDLGFITESSRYKQLRNRVRQAVGRGVALAEFEKSPPLDTSVVVAEVLRVTRELRSEIAELSEHFDRGRLATRLSRVKRLQAEVAALAQPQARGTLSVELREEISGRAGDQDLVLWTLAEELAGEERSIEAWLAFAEFLRLERQGQRHWPTAEEVRTLITLHDGDVPGEEILVKRMLLGLLESSCPSSIPDKIQLARAKVRHPRRPCDLSQAMPLSNIIYFQRQGSGGADRGVGFFNELLKSCKKGESAVLDFRPQPTATSGQSAPAPGSTLPGPPAPTTRCAVLGKDYIKELHDGMVLALNEEWEGRRLLSPLQMLRSVLALERLLELNPKETFPRTLKAFHEGREVVLPTEDDLLTGNYVIDRETSLLYFKTLRYYDTFVDEFNNRSLALTNVLPVFEVIPERAYLRRQPKPRAIATAAPTTGSGAGPAGARVVVRVSYRADAAGTEGSSQARVAPSPEAFDRPAPDPDLAALRRRLMAEIEGLPE